VRPSASVARSLASRARGSGFGPLAFVICTFVVLGLTVFEFTRSRAPATLGNGLVWLTAEDPVRVRTPVDVNANLADLRDENATTVVALIRRRGVLEVMPIVHFDDPVLPRRVRLVITASPTAVDIGSSSESDQPVATIVVERPLTTRVSIRSLANGRPVAEASFPTIRRTRSTRRDYKLADWSGITADLVVVDRDPAAGTTRVRILAGEALFREQLLDVTTDLGRGFSPSHFDLTLGSVNAGPKPDLVFVTKFAETGSGMVEVHVLSGEANFSRFEFEMPTPIRATDGDDRRWLFGSRTGRPTLLAVDLAAKEAQVVPLDRFAPGRT
jgi:hypothetical protein